MAMKDVMGIIYTSKGEMSMRELTSKRNIPALPVAARYRLVDFMLSSMVNSGVRNVGFVMQGSYHSLMDHLGTGKEWDLHTRNNGLFLLPPFHSDNNGYAGALDGLKANFDYLRRSKQDLVLLSGASTILNGRFDDMFRVHAQSGADVTMLYAKYDPMTFDYSHSSTQRIFLNMDEENCVKDMEVNPNVATYPNLFLDVVLIKRTLLMHLVDQASAHGQHTLVSDVLQSYVKEGLLRVMGYEYHGYCRQISTIKSYFNMNMDLLNPEVRRELFAGNPVYTKTRDDAPSKYLDGAKVSGSLVADGCVIEGTVENSVLFRGVHVGPGAHIKNSIVMQDCQIGANVELENVILDKDVTMLNGARLIGVRQYPIVIGKNVTL